MATLSWVRGRFGLISFQMIAEAFNGDNITDFSVTFEEDKGDKFTGVTQQTDPTFTAVTQQTDPTFTSVYSVI